MTDFVRRYAALALTGAIALTLTGCQSPQETTDPQAGQVPEASQTTEEEPADASSAEFEDFRYVDDTTLVDIEGNAIELESPDYELAGPFSEGLAFVTWETGSYDEEWDTAYDVEEHAGFVDKDGRLVIDLEDVLSQFQGDHKLMYCNNVYFSGGVCALNIVGEAQGYGETDYVENLVVIDEKGNVVVLASALDGTYSAEGMGLGQEQYDNGYLTVWGKVVIDDEGTIVVDARAWDRNVDHIQVVGDNLVLASWGFSDSLVDFSGNDVEIEEELAGDAYEYAVVEPLGANLLYVTLQEQNPHDATDHRPWHGILDYATGSWVMEPTLQPMEVGPAHNGVCPVSVEEYDDVSGTGSDRNVHEVGTGLLRADGSWALKPRADVRGADSVSYLAGGVWSCRSVDPSTGGWILVDASQDTGADEAPYFVL